MKTNKKKWLVPLIVVIVLAAIIGGGLYMLSQDDLLDMKDVYSMIKVILINFIPFAILAVILIIVGIKVKGSHLKKRSFMKWQSVLVLIVAFVVTINYICFGPMQTVLTLSLSGTKVLTEEVKSQSEEITEQLTKEGIVLLKNDSNMLPLSGKKVNVFGWASTNPCYGGTGSGSVDTKTCVTLLEGLHNAGIETNDSLANFYKEFRADRPVVGMLEQDWTLPEPNIETYPKELLEESKAYSEDAVIVITRVGGEGADLPSDMTKVTYTGNSGDFKAGESYLELSGTEKEMIEMVTSTFENVIVIYNGANPMELGWLDEYKEIKSALWIAGPGQNGFNSLGKIITGEANPSGRLVDTFAYDLFSAPTANNFGSYSYEEPKGYTFVNYVENIYLGYRFYETYYLGNEEGYQKAVQYPFGYGLSYTSFEQKMGELNTGENGDISFDVTVTNTGEKTGKDVVEVYYTAPYTNGGIEKSAVDLVRFQKTDELKPGDSQTITINFKEEDMASYDTKGAGAYVLEEGDYEIKVMSDAHTVLDSRTYQVKDAVIYNEEQPRSTDEEVADNTFTDYTEGNVVYLSRTDNFANYKDAIKPPSNYKMDQKDQENLTNDDTYVIPVDETDEMPVTGAKNKVELYDLREKEYEDPMWEDLLDKLTVEDMKGLISVGGYQTVPVKSIKKLATTEFDGPAGFSNFFNAALKGSVYPSTVLIAATWNQELAYEHGVLVGKEAKDLGISGWYAPGINIHRSAFSGRNFEYYSEDGLLSGKMAAGQIKGAASEGVYSYMKHFALNDQETNRIAMLCTWASEQSMREVYLKGFEIAVKEGGATAAMSSFNYVGNEWAGGSSRLLNDVLRGEWGFRGMVVTDAYGDRGYMSSDKAIRNGTDLMLSTTGEMGAVPKDTTSATAVKAMRTASHNILYTVVNSNAYDNYNGGSQLEDWMKLAIRIDVLLACVFVGLESLIIVRYKKK